MKANHLLTRLRQDLRKMVLTDSEAGYLRYKHFAASKVAKLKDHYKHGRLNDEEVQAFRDCAVTLVEIVNLHDATAQK